MKQRDALAQLDREIARARRALTVERLARLALWPLLAAGLWALFALVGGHEALPPLAQSLTAVAALVVLASLATKGVRGWRRPSETEARARLAVDSNLDAGAFEALEDRPSRLDPVAIALWRVEQSRAAARAKGVKARPARPELDRFDRWRLRFFVAIALMLAAIFAGSAGPGRLARAFYPDPGPLLGDRPISIEAWLTPAAYTGGSPVSLSDRIGQRVEAPPSVQATVRVTGPRGAPLLIFEGRGRRDTARFVRAPDGAYEAKLDIPHAGRLKVVRFHERAAWRIAPGADAAPRVALASPITFGRGERASFTWLARDDYGLREVALRVTPTHPPKGLVRAPPVDTPLESPAGDPRQAEGDARLDLADHPYAGLEVIARLVARDAKGQEGESAAVRLRLPEKVFLQPLARSAVEIRRMALWERRAYARENRFPFPWIKTRASAAVEKIVIRTDDPAGRLERAPMAVRRAAQFLDALTMHPEDGFFADQAVYVGLRFAQSALENARQIDETNVAAAILWQTALRAEYGDAADARRALAEAQHALSEALQNGASQDRIAQLTDALQRAMDNYLQALVQEAMRRGEETQEDTREQAELSQRDLQKALEEIERLSKEGRQDEAEAMLQQLASILQNLEVRLQHGADGEQTEQPDQQGSQSELQQSMQGLSGAMGQQRQLNDDTRSEGEGGEGKQGTGEGLAERQSQIRQGLDAARRQAGRAGAEQGQALGQADRSMRNAEEALRRGAFEDARAAQEEAMRNLREGAAALATEMRRRESGEQLGEEGSEGERDPLGRLRGGVGDNGDTRVPTEVERARSRDILNELRRRAQDPRRPEAERQYLRRLLDRFADS